MRPQVEQLESRDCPAPLPGDAPVISSGPMGDVHELVVYDKGTNGVWDFEPVREMPCLGMSIASAWSTDVQVWPWTEEKDFVGIAKALSQPDNPGMLDGPVFVSGFDLWRGHFAVDAPMNPEFYTVQHFEMPNALSVGMSLGEGGQITVYQVAATGLWANVTTNWGESWSGWQQLTDFGNVPAVSGGVPEAQAFGWLMRLELPPPGYQFGDPIEVHAGKVYGTVLDAGTEGVRFGVEIGGERMALRFDDGVLYREALSELFTEGEWQTEAEFFEFVH